VGQEAKNKKKRLELSGSNRLNLQWLGDEGSNLDKRSQSPNYTIESQYAFTDNYSKIILLSNVVLLFAVVHYRLFFAPSALKMH
jgi:hypothetical protein